MTVAEYLRRKDALHNTTFIVNARSRFYLVEGNLVPAIDWEKRHQLPESLRIVNGKRFRSTEDEHGIVGGHSRNKLQ